MIRSQTIDRAIDIIVAQCDPEQIFVIGSYATGTAKRTSDLDLLIVQVSTEAKRKRNERVELLLAPLLIPIDVDVYTPDEFEEERRERFGFARTATELQSKLVYSRELGDFASLHQRWDAESGAVRHQRLQDAPPSGSSTRRSTRAPRAPGPSRPGRMPPRSCANRPMRGPTSAAVSAPSRGLSTG